MISIVIRTAQVHRLVHSTMFRVLKLCVARSSIIGREYST